RITLKILKALWQHQNSLANRRLASADGRPRHGSWPAGCHCRKQYPNWWPPEPSAKNPVLKSRQEDPGHGVDPWIVSVRWVSNPSPLHTRGSSSLSNDLIEAHGRTRCLPTANAPAYQVRYCRDDAID